MCSSYPPFARDLTLTSSAPRQVCRTHSKMLDIHHVCDCSKSAPSTSGETHSKPHSTEPSLLQLLIRTPSVGLYRQPPENITSDRDVQQSMTTDPPSPCSPSEKTCLLSGPLDDFLLIVVRRSPTWTISINHFKWLIDIAHDVCDPKQKRGSLRVWDKAGRM
jgi:hypothetical protein